jgi:hypothetical protein
VQALPGKGRIQPGHKVLVNGASGEAGDVRGADRTAFGAEVTGV